MTQQKEIHDFVERMKDLLSIGPERRRVLERELVRALKKPQDRQQDVATPSR